MNEIGRTDEVDDFSVIKVQAVEVKAGFVDGLDGSICIVGSIVGRNGLLGARFGFKLDFALDCEADGVIDGTALFHPCSPGQFVELT